MASSILNSDHRSLLHRKDRLANKGYDYSTTVFDRTMSKSMWSANATFTGFLDMLQRAYAKMIDSVKSIKVYANIAADRHDDTIN